jgi:hypothetical protein
MANRRDFYFRQKVTEAELDGAFAELENADRAITSDLGFIGVAVGLAVAQQVSPNLTVLISGPGVAYDQTGQRVAIPSSQTLNCAVDEDAVNTAVVTPGNSRILSIFIEFDRTLSDPRVDGNSATVYYNRAESYRLNVAAGAEAVSPTAPVLRSDQVLLADITIAYGATQIVNGNISVARREWAIKTTSGVAVGVGTVEEAIQALASAVGTDATALASHLADTTDAHDASAISFSPTGLVASTDVQAAIAEVSGEKLALAGGTMSGDIDLNGNDITNGGGLYAGGFVGNSFDFPTLLTRYRTIPLRPSVTDGSGWIPDPAQPGEWITDGAIFNQKIWFDLLPHLPHGCEFQAVQIIWEQTAGFAGLGDQMRLSLVRHQVNLTTYAPTNTTLGIDVYYGAGTGRKINTSNPANIVIDREGNVSDTALVCEIDAAVGGVSRVAAIRIQYGEPGPRTN